MRVTMSPLLIPSNRLTAQLFTSTTSPFKCGFGFNVGCKKKKKRETIDFHFCTIFLTRYDLCCGSILTLVKFYFPLFWVIWLCICNEFETNTNYLKQG